MGSVFRIFFQERSSYERAGVGPFASARTVSKASQTRNPISNSVVATAPQEDDILSVSDPQDFERGRGHLVFQLTLKFACYLQPPLLLLGAADQCPSRIGRARLALKKCLESSCEHPQVKRLRAGQLSRDASLYVEGEDIRLLPELQEFLAELRFGFGSERLVEGGHARVHMANIGRRHRTEAMDSLALRMGEIEATLTSADVTSLLECLQAARNPRSLIHELGLAKHPSLQTGEEMNSWDPCYRLVVYHADAFSMYSRDGQPQLRKAEPESAIQRHAPRELRQEEALEIGTLLQTAAVKHVRDELLGKYADPKNGRWLFSCKLTQQTLHVLIELMAPLSVDEVDTNFIEIGDMPSPADVVEEARLGPSAFFQIASARPSRAKLPAHTVLRPTDIGIVIMKCEGYCEIEGTRHVRVRTSPVQTTSVLQEALEMAREPLVLSLSALDLTQLQSFVAWPETNLLQAHADDAEKLEILLSKEGSQRLLTVRTGTPSKDQTLWELLQSLQEHGWQGTVGVQARPLS